MDWQLETLGGARVAMARHTGVGDPVVLLGAWPQTVEAWAAVWERLGDRTRLAVDLPGFGHSARAPSTPSLAGSWLVKALDELGWDRVHLVGPDVGAPVAMWMATHHPERLHSMVVSDGPGTWPPTLSWDLGMMMRSGLVRWMMGRIPARFVRIAAERGYVARDAPDTTAAEAAYRDKLHHNLRYLASYPTELPPIAASPSITTPTFVLWGGDDGFVPAANARAIAEALPNHRLTILDGVGHFSHDDAPDAYADALLDWLDTAQT